MICKPLARASAGAALVTGAVLVTAAFLGCGSGEPGGGTAAAPSRAGEVWELDNLHDRDGARAALLAYVNGLHVAVLDGDRLYAGMIRLTSEPGANGELSFALRNGLSATLAPTGDAMELRFSTGDRTSMRRQPERPTTR